MALYQPTNVIPSSYTKGTVDAVNDKMEISWQVNGNSAMTAFQIDFYLNDYASTPVTSTGKKGTTPEEQKQLGLPFYGTDRFGRPQFFTWNAEKTWENWSLNKLTNGNEYKYKITQWFNGNSRLIAREGRALNMDAVVSGRTYYMRVYLEGSSPAQYLGYVSFTPIDSDLVFMQLPATVYYDFESGKGWVITNTGIYHEIPMNLTKTQPQGSESWSGRTVATRNTNDHIITQNDFSAFITRDKPTLKMQLSDNSKFDNPVDLGNTLTTSIGYFHAVYEQSQNDSIRWIKWQVATAIKNTDGTYGVGEIIADTGDISTPTLNYEYNGFFNGQSYAIRAIVESASGQECNSNSTTDGWLYFDIDIVNQENYNGEFTVQCLNKENATLLKWDKLVTIEGTLTGETLPAVPNGYTTLLPNTNIMWNKVNADNMVDRFVAPWTAALKIRLTRGFNLVAQDETMPKIHNFTFSPDGSILICIENSVNHYATVYSVSDTKLSKLTTIQRNGTALANTLTAGFSSDGKYLIIGGRFTGAAALFSVNGTAIDYIADIVDNGMSIGNNCLFVRFLPDTYGFILSGTNSSLTYSSEFRIDTSGSTPVTTKIMDLTGENGDIVLDGVPVGRASFTPNGELLVLGGDARHVSVFAVGGTNLQWLYDIKSASTLFTAPIDSQAISPDGKMLLLSYGGIPGVHQYSIQGDKITYIKSFYDAAFTRIKFMQFSRTNNYLVMANDASNNIIVCSVIGSDIAIREYITDLNISSSNSLSVIEFSPAGDILAFGGNFAAGIAIYDFTSQVQESGVLWTIGDDNILLLCRNNTFQIKHANAQLAAFSIPDNADSIAIIVTPTKASAYFYANNELESSQTTEITYTQQPINFVQAFGGDTGLTIENIAVYSGDGSNIIPLYGNPDFLPSWFDDNYALLLSTMFNQNYNAGSGSGFRIYRQEVGKNILTPIATVSSLISSVKDFGIASRKAYKYSLYAYDNNGAFMSAVENEKVVVTCFRNYSLLVCDYDETNDEYHVRKQYLFALNLSAGSVGNNNSPTLNANFTRYPTRMPSTQNYASGTLSGLIGAIYTVPALIEQIGNYKWTAKPSTMDYFDSVDLEQELYDLSTAPYQLFLRDMKGRLRMVATNGAITMTTNIKQKQQSISISFPWVEIGDASDVTIIQTPDDYGWNNDNQVLDVSLDVDVETGELSATYPSPYNGTKFYLTGVNKETLTAKTPLGITPAQFELSDVAEQPDDGKLNATVKVNSEDN